MIQFKTIQDLAAEPITLVQAKEWMQIDYPDWDMLIGTLITASRQFSEKVSGQAYGEKIIEVTGNQKECKVYPIQPFIEDVEWADEDGVVSYRYKCGWVVIPDSLKISMLQRIATGFAYRQNGVNEAVNAVMNPALNAELKYTYLFV